MNAGLLSQRKVESGAAAYCGQGWWEKSVANDGLKGFLHFLTHVVFDKTTVVQLKKIKREKQFSETKMILQELHLVGFHSSF